ncbi:peptidoglycan bridge formation glycyltransferase FemA/FemB family protein [Candidatus Roizmanbacteria bacterium]|nr:peptidoglycan bridge formation glycyltransferase FemA/FemB family protein [Candidatus Roizmanbacteria bacterium]
MEVKIIASDFDKNLYNSKAIHPLQSWEWGEARKKHGVEVIRIGEFEGETLKHVYQLTLHTIPYFGIKIGYLPRSEFPSNEVLRFLKEFGQKNNVIFIKIEPYVLAANHSQKTKNSDLKKSPHPLFPKWTQILDLTLSEDQLLKKMKPKTRYNIKLAQKKGVDVKEINNEEGFKIFAKLYFETCKRQKYYGHNYAYHEALWKTLKNGISYILIAYYKALPLAAFELLYFHNTLYYVYGGTSLEYRNLMASNLIMWEAIRLGIKLGAKKFDMWGSLPPNYDSSHPWAGFTRYKEGYGGEFIEFIGSYDLVISPPSYRIYSLLYHVRKLYLGLKRIF